MGYILSGEIIALSKSFTVVNLFSSQNQSVRYALYTEVTLR